MTNFFSFNFTFPFGMNNWFTPTWSFQNFTAPFQMSAFNFDTNWFSPFSFNYSVPQLNSFSIFPINYSLNNKPKKGPLTQTDTFTRSSYKNYDTDNLTLSDYNPNKGKRLADIALRNSVGWTGYCARYVKSSIQEANLGPYVYGHAYQMPSILRYNRNFKEISPDKVDVKELPAGCVLVYNKGTEGYNKKYGHTEITTGDGRAVSDGITTNLNKKPSTIFIPV